MAKTSMKERREALGVILEENQGLVLDEALTQKILSPFFTQTSQVKVDENGNVFCGYWKQYLPSEEFKINRKNRFESMSKEGKRLHRLQKTKVQDANTKLIDLVREGKINGDKFTELLQAVGDNTEVVFERGTQSLPLDYPFSMTDNDTIGDLTGNYRPAKKPKTTDNHSEGMADAEPIA